MENYSRSFLDFDISYFDTYITMSNVPHDKSHRWLNG
jgi:hypothetical protein